MRQKVHVIFSFKAIISILFISLLYLCVALFAPNYKLLFDTVFGTWAITYKIGLIIALFSGLFTALSPIDAWLLSTTALLVGINIVLLIKAVKLIGKYGALHLSIGGASIIGLVAAGCTSCGFSFLAVLGLGTSLSFLPFHGTELHIISVVFLLGSAGYMLARMMRTVACRII